MNAPTTRTTRATAAASKTNPTASAVIKVRYLQLDEGEKADRILVLSCVQAYLRIRPAPHVVAVPYLDIRDERTVTMTPPNVGGRRSIDLAYAHLQLAGRFYQRTTFVRTSDQLKRFPLIVSSAPQLFKMIYSSRQHSPSSRVHC